MQTAINVVKDSYLGAVDLIERHPHQTCWLIVVLAAFAIHGWMT